jgi:tetratricopeptide (TPR) repeat protein
MWYGYSLERTAQRDRRGWQDARDALEKCIAIDENFSECHYRLGSVYMYMDEERKALESYTKSIRMDPTKIERYPLLADLYLNLDFVDEAEMVLKAAKKFAKPGDRSLFWVHVLQSEVHNLRGAEAERITELETANLVANGEGPEAVQILFMLGATYAVANPPRREKAITNLQGFVQRACKVSKASLYPVECSQAQTLISRMGAASP